MSKIKYGLIISLTLCISICMMMLIIAAEDNGEKKIFTRDMVNEIAINKDNKYGTPNKYWNEETGVFTIPDGYEEIESFISSNEDNKGNIICDKIRYVNIPDSVKEIREGSFGDSSIRKIKWPKNVIKIEDYMFGYAILGEIEIPDTVTHIGKGVFLSNAIKEIEIPDSVVEIGEGAFTECSFLQRIKLPKDLKCIPKNMLSYTCALEEINIPEGVREIGADGMTGCKFKEIKLPRVLTKIGDRGFWCCEKLERIEMPGVKELGKYVFSNCDKLREIVISKEFFKSEGISKEAFEASDREWPVLTNKSVKDRSVDVYVEDGIEGINIEEIKRENKWIKKIEPILKIEKQENKKIPETGIDKENIMMMLLAGLSMMIIYRLKQKDNI